MKKNILFFYYCGIVIFCLLLINNFCYADSYEINRKLGGKEFVSKIPDFLNEKYPQDTQRLVCDIENLFNEPIKIIILYELLRSVSAVLDGFRVDYWLSEETLLNYNKFCDFAPWQQDIQIAVDHDKFKRHLTNITTELAGKNIVFFCRDNILDLQKLPCVSFTKDGIIKIIKKYEPNLSEELIIKKCSNFTHNEKSLKLYFYPYNISRDLIMHSINYLYYIFIKSGKNLKGYNFNDIYPLKTGCLKSLTVKIPNEMHNILKVENRCHHFYQLHPDRTIYKKERSTNLKYIKACSELLPLLHDFMKFIVFADNSQSNAAK